MNLFRSEEHVTGWSSYDPESHEAIMSVEDWSYVMGADLFSRRFESDYLDHIDPYYEDWFTRLGELGRSGNFWRVGNSTPHDSAWDT
jgi:hypothetical protein